MIADKRVINALDEVFFLVGDCGVSEVWVDARDVQFLDEVL